MSAVPNTPHPARHLLRAKGFVDAHYFDPDLSVNDMADAAGLSRSHFTREFSNTFGESPRAYLLTRRLERATALLRNTDNSVLDVCLSVGLSSVGSFTSTFTRTYGESPSAYRARFPDPRRLVQVPECYVRLYGRPARKSARLEKTAEQPASSVALTD